MCSLGWHLMVKWLFPLSSIAIKLLSHLDLCQPYGLIFQLYIPAAHFRLANGIFLSNCSFSLCCALAHPLPYSPLSAQSPLSRLRYPMASLMCCTSTRSAPSRSAMGSPGSTLEMSLKGTGVILHWMSIRSKKMQTAYFMLL